MFTVTKKYGHNLGFSCAFRQWRADSHCRFLHGYSLAFTFEFMAHSLDARNWVIDFGGLKSLKGILEDHFDHKTLVAEDDPELDDFIEMHDKGMIDMQVVTATGCEAFAAMVYEIAEQWLIDSGHPSVDLHRVTVHEHEANSASYSRA